MVLDCKARPDEESTAIGLSRSRNDDADRREAAMARRLDRLTRQGERLQRDLWIAAETLALFIRFWLTVTPPLPESAQAAAQAKGRERFESFLETLGRRLAKGQSIMREISLDTSEGRVPGQTASTANAQS